MATIQDVAKAAGVSAMTVANVINDHPNVRRATREKVLEAMAGSTTASTWPPATCARAGPDVGVRVPEQVKVIGFDNVESSEFLVPSLSTIDPDHGAMAERAVALLARRIGQAELPQDREEFVSRFSPVVRESTGG